MTIIGQKQDEMDLLMETTIVEVVKKVVQSMMDDSQSNKQTESIDKKQMSQAERMGGFTSPEDLLSLEKANQSIMK